MGNWEPIRYVQITMMFWFSRSVYIFDKTSFGTTIFYWLIAVTTIKLSYLEVGAATNQDFCIEIACKV